MADQLSAYNFGCWTISRAVVNSGGTAGYRSRATGWGRLWLQPYFIPPWLCVCRSARWCIHRATPQLWHTATATCSSPCLAQT